MANFSFVSGAKFRPFSYQEMLQPLQAYTQEYNTIQEGMGELGTKADVFDRMATHRLMQCINNILMTWLNKLSH